MGPSSRATSQVDDFPTGDPTPGAKLEAIEIGRDFVKDRPAIVYRYRATGLPADKRYTMFSGTTVRLLGKREDRWLDADGTVLESWQGKTKPVEIILHSFGWGEKQRVALVSDDGTARAYANVIPFPLEPATGIGGCSVAAETIEAYADWNVTMSGFEPNESIHVTFSYDGTSYSYDLEAASDGTAAYSIMGGAIWGLWEDVTYRAVGSRCEVTLRLVGNEPHITHEFPPQ